MKVTVIPVTPFEQNCSLLVCEESAKAAVIDPGGDLDRIEAAIKQSGARLEKIFVTHAHVDHAGGVAELARRTSAPVEGPQRGDQYWIDVMEEHGRDFGFEFAEPFTPNRWLEDGENVRFGNITLEVLHCPGHTPGHVAFYYRAQRLAFVGDVLFRDSVGRTDFPGGDWDTLVRSITQKLWPLGDDVQFISGHGPVSTFGRERQTNPWVSDRELANPTNPD
ncbi:MAG: MBL fold metallo-hydrolase [Gammaproteobacteria bacterium]|jgi:glyoxylase-like metal-dependent hydrolase (beta-lactamase superfamily II)|nr:MAG: MBL fold metallo-hydrolase [Gammaproteobacteria bacterium]